MADARPHIRPVAAIVADDIRREASGKETIIGVYTGQIVVAQVGPEVGIMLAIAVMFEAPETGEIPVHLQISGPADDQGIEIHGAVDVKEPTKPKQINSLSVSGIPVPLTRQGELSIKVRQYDDGEWETVRILPITVNPDDPGLRANPSLSSIAHGRPF